MGLLLPSPSRHHVLRRVSPPEVCVASYSQDPVASLPTPFTGAFRPFVELNQTLVKYVRRHALPAGNQPLHRAGMSTRLSTRTSPQDSTRTGVHLLLGQQPWAAAWTPCCVARACPCVLYRASRSLACWPYRMRLVRRTTSLRQRRTRPCSRLTTSGYGKSPAWHASPFLMIYARCYSLLQSA